MDILIMGMGYVGVTTGLVFADLGWDVTGYDPNQERLQSLARGTLPFFEPGLSEKLAEHRVSGKIRFTSDLETAVSDCEVIFLCVGTPPQEDGSADLQYIRQASASIGQYMNRYKLVVIKSTVPVGTNERVAAWIGEAQRLQVRCDVVSNPEFLREGTALHDALHPDRIVIGSHDPKAARKVHLLYRGIKCPVVLCNPRTSELIKYASNAFLATKISYMNELARLCDQLDINVKDVAAGMGLDSRIGQRFLHAGIGYGGSCFPKDIQSLLYEARYHGIHMSILERVDHVNRTQVSYAIRRWERAVGTFRNKKVAVLGLAFKKDTDDMREAPSISVIRELLDRQAYIQAHDPLARLPDSMLSAHLRQVGTIEESLDQADAVIISADWQQYMDADWELLRTCMKRPVICDGKNMLNGKRMESLGYAYYGIGSSEGVIAAE